MPLLPNEIRRGDKLREQRGFLNRLLDFGNDAARRLGLIETRLTRLERAPFKTERLPFEVYFVPLSFIAAPTVDELDAWWRTFIVRHGYVNFVKCTGADDADEEGTVPEVIIVPEDATEYFVWLEITLDGSQDVTTVEVKHGERLNGVLTNPDASPADWNNFPKRSTDPTKVFRLLAKIDASVGPPARIRQFVRDDIALDGVGGGGDGGYWQPA